jgi:hemerythrin
MAFLDWSDEYKCGIRVLDYGQRNLFNIVNSFHESVHTKNLINN